MKGRGQHDDGPKGGANDDGSESEGRSLTFWIVVAVILAIPAMIAITVILAAVIGAFVLGIGDATPNAPQVSWDYDHDPGANVLTVEHSAGDSVEAERLRITVDGQSRDDWSAPGGTITGGDAFTVEDVAVGQDLRIFWDAPDDSGSTLIGEFAGESGYEPAATAPQIAWDYRYDANAGVLTATHAGGDSAEGALLRVDVDGEPREDWSAPSGTFAAGDSFTVEDVGTEQDVRIVWERPDDSGSVVIGWYQGES